MLVGWLIVLRIYVASAVFQPYRDLEAGVNQSLKIQVARRGIEPRSSCFASQELNHSATAAPFTTCTYACTCNELLCDIYFLFKNFTTHVWVVILSKLW